MKRYLAIDVGGSAIKYGVVLSDQTILHRGEVPTPHDTMENLLSAYRWIYTQCGDGVDGVGISFTATMDAKDGYCFGGALQQYTGGQNLLSVFQTAFPVPVAVENDGNCAALAEGRYGSLKDCQDAVMIVLGTGIGGGLLHQGQIHRGKRSCSGEFSYVFTNYGMGRNTVWAEHNGTRSLTAPLAKAKGEPDMDGRRFFEYANEGDEEALSILRSFTDFLAIQIFNLQCIYAPDRVAIGGGISRQPLLMEFLQQSLDRFYEHGPCLPRAEVVAAHFRSDANLIGAVCHLLDTQPALL